MKQLHALVLALGMVLFWAAHSHAAKNQVQVLALSSNDAFENAQAFTAALKRAVARSERFSLAPGDFSLEVLTALFNCTEPPDAECLAKIGAKVQSDRFIWGTLQRSGPSVVAELHLWDDGSERGRTRVEYSSALVDPANETLLGLAGGAIDRLLGRGGSKLVVRATTPSGDLFVNGSPAGKLSGGRAELEVPEGQLAVELRAQGFRPARQRVSIAAGEAAELSFEPVRDESGDSAEVPRNDAGPKSRSQGRRAVGYSALALGGVAAGVGAAFWIQTAQQKNDEMWRQYRETVSMDVNPCEQAVADQRQDIVDHCDANKRARTAARILIPSGLVIAGIGTVLLATSKSPNTEKISLGKRHTTSRLELQPEFGPRGGHLDFRWSF